MPTGGQFPEAKMTARCSVLALLSEGAPGSPGPIGMRRSWVQVGGAEGAPGSPGLIGMGRSWVQ